MKNQLDQLMHDRGLDAVYVSGRVKHNPTLTYLVDGAGLTHAEFVKKRNEPPVLIVGAMEREEAQAAGLPIVLNNRYNYPQLLEEHDGNRLKATVAYVRRVFEDQQIEGRVGCYGLRDQGTAYALLTALDATLPNVEIVGEMPPTLISAARAIKSTAEVDRIREVARRTAQIVKQTVSFLQQHAVDVEEILRRDDGEPLTVGDVHAQIRRFIALQGLEDPEGFIFSTGRDAGIPHSKGTHSKPIRLGESIVFDIFPCEQGGGYFFDMTRTFCLGYAPSDVQQLWEDTRLCLGRVCDALAAGEETYHYQQMACACFKEQGHPTVADDATTISGYVHGLGHGLGLELHEAPSFRFVPGRTTRFEPGHVFTIEPGLYYPDDGIGCRLEDVFWIDENGTPQLLTDFPYELVIPMS